MAGREFNETLGASHAQILGVWGLRRLKPKLWGFFKFNTPIYYGFIIILFYVARCVFGQYIFIHFCLIVFLVNFLFIYVWSLSIIFLFNKRGVFGYYGMVNRLGHKIILRFHLF